jgi:hypothetical protein
MNYRNAIKNKDGFINCELDHPKYGWIPFQASANDPAPHGQSLYNSLNNSSDLQYETDEEYTERKSLVARTVRNNRLREEVDPLISNPIRFSELPIEKQNEWTVYRTALLNIPQQEGFPHEIEWPTKPQ